MNLTPVDFDPFKDLDKIIPTSEPQREILGSVKFGNDAANCAYNESLTLKLTGPFVYDAIVKAANAVVARHGSLRATFIEEGVKMRIADNTTIDVPLIDISNIATAEQQAHLNEIITEDVSAPFDLPNGPLFDVKVIKLAAQLHYVIITAHHIVCDGWSMGIVMQDLSAFYNQHVTGQPAVLQPAIQFDDYVADEIAFEASTAYETTAQYWLNLYKDYNQVFELPTDKPRPALRSYNAKRIDCPLPNDVITQIKKAGAQLGCSLVNTLIAAYEVFLFKLTKQPNIILGLPSAGQSVTDNYSLVGHCVNLLPLKTRVDGNTSFSDYLVARKKTLFDAFENQRYTFGTLIKKLNVPRDPSRIPLVPVAFNADLGLADGVAFEKLQLELFSNPRNYENFEIFFNISGQQNNLAIECTFNTDLYDNDLMHNRLHEFVFVLEQLAADMKTKINNVQLTPINEVEIIK
ncbi:MAG TPA: condensation domain-containing protein, partial [Bacteroidia bacterium]|nr:condensation domain-containing protein [Bacteroidia bacterium]